MTTCSRPTLPTTTRSQTPIAERQVHPPESIYSTNPRCQKNNFTTKHREQSKRLRGAQSIRQEVQGHIDELEQVATCFNNQKALTGREKDFGANLLPRLLVEQMVDLNALHWMLGQEWK